MKTLMIGMDGAQLDTFRRGWTPFLESLVAGGTPLSLHEDLLSRGWAEILFGEHAVRTGAFYERPSLDGSYQWTDSFKLSDVPGLGDEVRPLWDVLNQHGIRVGFMNVPTTSPAPKVDGFFVSGGGGGRGVSKQVSEEQCSPPTVAGTLNEMGYILDARSNIFWEYGVNDPKRPIGHLVEMTKHRTGSFKQLVKAHAVDFGFVVYRSIVMAETLVLPELYRMRCNPEYVNRPLLNAIEDFYRQFDEQMKLLVESFPGAQVILVSDHAMAPRQWDVDFNRFLVKSGYQLPSVGRAMSFNLTKKIKQMLPVKVRRLLKGSTYARQTANSLIDFDPKKTVAFNVSRAGAARGIYINDQERFGGPIERNSVEKLRLEIMEAFNDDPVANKHRLRASIPSSSVGKHFSDAFPDVWIDMPDGYYPVNGMKDFVTPYPGLGQPVDLKKAATDMRMSVKAHTPLAVLCGGNWQLDENTDKCDLTLIYQHLKQWGESNY